jgi:NAD(P)H-dependent FMN reductase
VSHLRDEVNAAGAVLFSTPQYGGSMPGSLKNLLDWLADGGELAGKPVAWLSVAADGQDDGARTTLESVLVHGRARVLRHACIRIPLDQDAVNEQGMVADPQFRTAVQDVFGAVSSALAAAVPREAPSWQAYSSVYPLVPRRDRTPFHNGRAHT